MEDNCADPRSGERLSAPAGYFRYPGMGVSISSVDEVREKLDLPPWAEELSEPVVFTAQGPVPFSKAPELFRKMQYTTKDSGAREEYPSGMRRDTQEGKPRFDLLIPDGVPYEAQFLTRLAGLMLRGAEKYGLKNWEKASSQEEMDRFRASAFRHMVQWMCEEADEDHMAAVAFNLLAYETTKWKVENAVNKQEAAGEGSA